ncbi:hypothetical protein B6U91_00085 [Candidatus Pacearchaeota archaeon ex4484_71]|nr:MAG: hypothetical protein B6U91_00085 [Candidatus Pacearchaeota archaeon ex4484_71]
MEFLVVPGLNGLGKTNGVQDSYKQFFNDCKILDLPRDDVSKQLFEIKTQTKRFFEMNKFLFFGGDHSISYPLVYNFFKKFGDSGKLIVLDSHPDTMSPMNEPTHEEWLRAIVEDGFSPKNILIFGIRRDSENVDSREISYLLEKGIKFFYSDEILEFKEFLRSFIKSPLYVSVDVDVFDSSSMPCTGYPEKGGPHEESIFEILNEISRLKENLFFDIVELNFKNCNKKESVISKNNIKKVLKIVGVN